MKKFVLSVAALAALSSVALAQNRNYDLRDVQPGSGQESAIVEQKPLAASDVTGSNFERLNLRAEQREQGDR